MVQCKLIDSEQLEIIFVLISSYSEMAEDENTASVDQKINKASIKKYFNLKEIMIF